MTQRQEKVNSLLQRQIAQYLRDQDFEGLKGLVTVTAVDSSPDLEYAKVFFSVIGQKPEEVEEILRKNIYSLQGMLNRKLKMRKVPRLSFIYDHSGEYAQQIARVIKDIHNEQVRESDKPVPGGKKTDTKS